MKRLNIFIDETGNFGSKENSRLYGVSFAFHDSNIDIEKDISNLNIKLEKIKFNKMIHMADLVCKRGDYSTFDINKRKKIFWCIYHFSRKLDIKIKTIIIDKNFVNQTSGLIYKLETDLSEFIESQKKWLNKYEKIVIYYDNGQHELAAIIKNVFSQFNNAYIKTKFDHKGKRLFQTADMLTFIDKLSYKQQKNIPKSLSEKIFFEKKEFQSILSELKNKRL